MHEPEELTADQRVEEFAESVGDDGARHLRRIIQLAEISTFINPDASLRSLDGRFFWQGIGELMSIVAKEKLNRDGLFEYMAVPGDMTDTYIRIHPYNLFASTLGSRQLKLPGATNPMYLTRLITELWHRASVLETVSARLKKDAANVKERLQATGLLTDRSVAEHTDDIHGLMDEEEPRSVAAFLLEDMALSDIEAVRLLRLMALQNSLGLLKAMDEDRQVANLVTETFVDASVKFYGLEASRSEIMEDVATSGSIDPRTGEPRSLGSTIMKLVSTESDKRSLNDDLTSVLVVLDHELRLEHGIDVRDFVIANSKDLLTSDGLPQRNSSLGL